MYRLLAKIAVVGALVAAGSAGGAQIKLPYPQGTAFPLEMYEVGISDVPKLTNYGWNVVQSYNLNTTNDVANYLQGVSPYQVTGVGVIPCYTTNTTDYEWTQSQVQSWVRALAGSPNLAWWDLPEEMRYWVSSELKVLQDYPAWTRLYDPARHPNYEYTSNNRNATDISRIAPWVDVIGISCYAEFLKMPHAWVRYKLQESGCHGLALAGKTQGSDYLNGQKTLVAVLWCAVSTNGIPTPAQTYHDFWSAIASGAQGISVFAYWHALHDNPPLTNNLQQLNLAASQITGPENIGAVILNGTPVSNVIFTVTSGPTLTVAFQPPGDTVFQYPSLNLLTKTWSNSVYMIAVNSTSNSISACVSNLPTAAASATLPFESRSVAMSGGSFADSFAPWGVHIYKMPMNVGPVVLTNVNASVAQNQILSLSHTKLLAVVTDPDNNPLSVASAGPTSTNGGMVTVTSTTVNYQPVTNYVGADRFAYTVSDSQGGTATNMVAVTVAPSGAVSLNVVYGPVITAGQFVTRFAGIPGYTYTIESTTNLFPMIWTKKVNLTAPLTDQGLGVGIFELNESSTNATMQFYRTVYPAY